MSEKSLSERLKWIRDEYFEGVQRPMAKAMGCGDSYLTALLNEEGRNLGHSLAVKLADAIAVIAKEKQKPEVSAGWILAGGGRSELVALRDAPQLGDLTWLFADVDEADLIGRLNRVLTDFEVPLDERVRRGTIVWNELRRRALSSTASDLIREEVLPAIEDLAAKRRKQKS